MLRTDKAGDLDIYRIYYDLIAAAFDLKIYYYSAVIVEIMVVDLNDSVLRQVIHKIPGISKI